MADTMKLNRNQYNQGKEKLELENPFVKPYYTDNFGSKSIGEPDWKPHGRNMASYPKESTEQYCKLGGNGLDWFSTLRCVKKETDTTCQLSAQKIPKDKSKKASEDYKTDIQRTEQKLSNNRIENARRREMKVDEEQERMLQRRPLEMTLEIAVGAKRKVADVRNGISVTSPGDKSYQVPEYSEDFHKQGCTLPVINFGGSLRYIPDTFVPLQDLPLRRRITFEEKEKENKKKQEIIEVVDLDNWKPANPLVATLQSVGTHS